MPASGPGARWRSIRAHAVVGAVQVRPDEVVEAVAALVVLAVRPADAARRDERVDRPERGRGGGERPLDAPRSRMSQASTCAAPSIDAAVSSSRSRPRARSVSVAPSRASRSAIARPMPVPAPVTTTCLPLKKSCGRSQFAAFPRRMPLRRSRAERRLPLRRARDASRTKLSRGAVRGSGRSIGEVDESAPGSANPWSF